MFKKFYIKVIKGICFIIAKVIYKTEVEGIEKIPEGEGVIICGNHVHGLDAPLLMALYPKKTICFMAKQELFKNKFLKFLGGLYNVFPVNRDINDTEAVRKALKVLKEKKILGIYPEGTRNGLAKGEKPKHGAVNIAIRTGAKIVPFGVAGDFKLFSKVKYTFGDPIDLSGYKKNAHDKEVVDILTNELMAKIVELRDKGEKVNIAIDKK